MRSALLMLALWLMTSTLSLVHANPLLEAVKTVEQRLDARVGIALYDSGTGESWDYHGDDRFPITSTFKTLACAALLAKVDNGTVDLDRRVIFSKDDLVTYSPVTETRVGEEAGMSLRELCEATMATSDNTAANLVLGPLMAPTALPRMHAIWAIPLRGWTGRKPHSMRPRRATCEIPQVPRRWSRTSANWYLVRRYPKVPGILWLPGSKATVSVTTCSGQRYHRTGQSETALEPAATAPVQSLPCYGHPIARLW